jgi:hypothetical protein
MQLHASRVSMPLLATRSIVLMLHPKFSYVHIAPTSYSIPAVLVTKPLVFKGVRLCLNADAGGSGAIVVTISLVGDLSGSPTSTSSHPFVLNSVNGAVEWVSGDLTLKKFEGKVVQLKFSIARAELYTFQFVDEFC